jgi:hypothetical protein
MKNLDVKSKKKCRRVFNPDPRVGDRQISCHETVCKSRRKIIAQRKWSKSNPDYFYGRYLETRIWKEKNPNYQKKWRNKRFEIQDKRT